MNIDVVVIGLNTERTLADCLQSILDSRYSRGQVSVYYVDSGSTDQSVKLANEYSGVQVLSLDTEYPSPGAGRNVGWRAGEAPLVQFLDSDTVLHPDWLDRAVDSFEKEKVGAVRGNLRERYPEASTYNWIADQEWNAQPGECDDFGGNVMIRREALIDTGGYDTDLVGGEDPELSQRVKGLGWRIWHLDEPMALHDLAMKTGKQYWKRCFRTGYGFAAVVDRHGKTGQGFWNTEFRRILIRGGFAFGLFLLSLLLTVLVTPYFLPGVFAGLVLVFYPLLFRVPNFARDKSLDAKGARVYACHCSVIVIPEFFGISRYWIGKVFNKPLRNSRVQKKAVSTFLTALIFLSICGCSTYYVKKGLHDFTQPDKKSQRDDFNVAGAFRSDSDKKIQTFASEKQVQAFSNQVPAEYYIGPGDRMVVEVRDRPEVSVKDTTVSPDGKISVPRVGVIRAKGKTIDELTEIIRVGLANFYETPDVTVHILEYNNNKVYVLGRVSNPGLVKFGGTGTLLEALAESGGLPVVAQDAFLARCVVFRGKDQAIWINLRELLESANTAMNPRLMNNDLVFVPDSDDRLAYVMGEVQSPGAVKLKTELSVMDALMAVGGPTRKGKLARIFLIRYEGKKGHVQQIRVNDFLHEGDLRQDYILKDGDIIYVTTKPFEEVFHYVEGSASAFAYLNFAALISSGTAF